MRRRPDGNVVTCANCGARVMRWRLQEHFLHPECLVREVTLHMRSAGWTLLPKRRTPLALAALGLRPDADLASVRTDPRRAGKLAFAPSSVVYRAVGWRLRRTRVSGEASAAVAWGWWCAPEVLTALRLLDGGASALGRQARCAAARRAYLDPEWADAVRAAEALAGPAAARSLVRAEVPHLVRALCAEDPGEDP